MDCAISIERRIAAIFYEAVVFHEDIFSVKRKQIAVYDFKVMYELFENKIQENLAV